MYKVKKFDDYGGDIQELLISSIKARERAYVPYSKFKVGAALLTICGKVINGCNVENAVLPLVTCAERTAIVKAVSDGFMEFVSIAVCGEHGQNDTFVTPCGSCRQIINEFKDEETNDFIIYLVKPDRSSVLETTLKNILPLPFDNYKK